MERHKKRWSHKKGLRDAGRQKKEAEIYKTETERHKKRQ